MVAVNPNNFRSEIDTSGLTIGKSNPAEEGLGAIPVDNHCHRLLQVADCISSCGFTGFHKSKRIFSRFWRSSQDIETTVENLCVTMRANETREHAAILTNVSVTERLIVAICMQICMNPERDVCVFHPDAVMHRIVANQLIGLRSIL